MLEEKEIHLRNYLMVIRKRRYTVYTFFAIVFALTLIVTFSTTPIYTATTKVLIEKNERAKMTALNPYYMDYDPDFNETQYQLIKSFSVAQRVVKIITPDPKIAAAVKTQEGNTDIVSGTFQWFRDLFSTVLHIGGRSPKLAPANPANPGNPADPKDKGLDPKAYQLAKDISNSIIVKPVKNSKIVDVSYMSPDPKLAALIVNAVAKAYMDEVLDIRMGSSQYALKWLTEKAEEERARLQKSEQALQEYMRDKDIATLENKLTMFPERVAEVATKLATAESKRKELETLYAQVKRLANNPEAIENLPAVASDPTMQSLRSQILKTEQTIMDYQKKYGEKHPAMVTTMGDLKILKEKKVEQIRRVTESIKNEYELAKASEENFRRFAGQTKAETLSIGEKFIQYGVLKREVETSRQLFDAIITRIKEQGVTQDIQTINAWVIEKAEIPKGPTTPKTGLNILLGLIAGLIGGVGLAFFIDYLDNTIKSPEEIDSRFDMPVLGMVELLSPEKGTIEEVVRKDPRSRIAENYRVIRTNILLSSAEKHPKNIVITSTSPQEGKTATAVNLAAILAQSGGPVLIMDADLRRPRIHKIFGIDNNAGLSTYLAGESDISFVSSKLIPNLSIVPAGPLPPNPSELLGSNRMKKLVASLEEKFDFIIWDSPPLFTVAESLVLCKMMNGTLFVTRAGKTTYEELGQGLKALDDIGARCLGVVINGLDLRESNSYYHRYYGYYHAPKKEQSPNPANKA
jgi:capsular exopolysaccharide synthesis family protein